MQAARYTCMMRCLRAITASLLLLLMMPLALACAELPGSAVAQHACCKPTDRCCEAPTKACCGTQTPAETGLPAFQSAVPLLLPPTAVAVAPARRVDGLTVHGGAFRGPAEHSPPGLLIVGTTNLRI